MTSAASERAVPVPKETIATKIKWRLLRMRHRTMLAARRAPASVAGAFSEVLHKLTLDQPRASLRLFGAMSRVLPRSSFLLQAQGLLTARTQGWDRATRFFVAPAAARSPGAAAALLRAAQTPPSDFALPKRERPAALDAETCASIVVYTSYFGAAARPEPVNYTIPGLRFLLLTDREDIEIAGWRTVRIVTPVSGAKKSEAWCRILAHEAMALAAPDAHGSLYLAPDRWLIGNLHNLLLRWCRDHDLALWRSEAGIDGDDVAEHALVFGQHEDPAGITLQAADLKARAVPRDLGAFDLGMIWRRHGDPGVAALMEDWWREQDRSNALEPISLYAALHDPARAETARPSPRLLPASLGTAADNAFLLKTPPKRPRRALARRTGKLPITFVYAPEEATSVTTELRIRQLGVLVEARYPDRYEISNTSETRDLSGRVVILIKHALRHETLDSLEALRKRNIALIGAWEDSLPDLARVAALDADMTVSFRQSRDHQRLFPATPSFIVGHHVNVLIRPAEAPLDRLRAGYFGEAENTHCPPSLWRLVDVVDLNVYNVNMSWIDQLPRYNCHWIVRRYRDVNAGGKPFLKGFVAARCGAVVVAGREDDDAVQYLGDDYPFFVESKEPAELERRMLDIAAAFGGPEWRFAREIMAQVAARSTDDVFCAEFRQMIDAVVA